MDSLRKKDGNRSPNPMRGREKEEKKYGLFTKLRFRSISFTQHSERGAVEKASKKFKEKRGKNGERQVARS